MLENVRDIIEGVSNSYGEDFFNKITLCLDKTIKADYTFIAWLDRDTYTSKTIALVAKGQLADNIEYSLKDTPCANVAEDSMCCYPKGVCSVFPNDQLLIDMKIEAYLGTPLHDSNHKVMGLVVALYEKPIADEQQVLTLFQVFSGRIAAEMERRAYEVSLEEKVAARTKELSAALDKLTLMQRQLVESEKMAALGNLVAGISHEVNTPLGIAITTHSIIADELKELNAKIDSESLTLKAMNSFREAAANALEMQGDNLDRAKKLIENFKKTAVDQHQLEIETINLGQYYQKITSTLRPLLKPKKVSLAIHCDDDINLATYPGVHAQIITNLISNSIRHGFNDANSQQDNQISFHISQVNDNTVEVKYQDNGSGLTEEAEKHVFEPFFTTARDHGGVGLGMSIIFNLITQKLTGNIEFIKQPVGACFTYHFTESKLNKL